RHTISKRDWSSDVCSSEIYKLRRKSMLFINMFAIAAVRDRSGRMLSAGTALASLPWQRVCRRCSQRTVLVDLPLSSFVGSSDTCYSRRTRKATTVFASHEENRFVFSRSHRPPLTRTGKAIDGKILYHFIQLKNCVIGKCYTSSPYTCPFIGVCRRWAHSPLLVGLPCYNGRKGIDETPE